MFHKDRHLRLTSEDSVGIILAKIAQFRNSIIFSNC